MAGLEPTAEERASGAGSVTDRWYKEYNGADGPKRHMIEEQGNTYLKDW